MVSCSYPDRLHICLEVYVMFFFLFFFFAIYAKRELLWLFAFLKKKDHFLNGVNSKRKELTTIKKEAN